MVENIFSMPNGTSLRRKSTREMENDPSLHSADLPIRVVLVDDHDMVRLGLKALLSDFDDIAVVGEAEDGREAIELCEGLEPDVVFMDYVMPRMNGAEATQIIHEKFPDMKIIMLTNFPDETHIQTSLRAGAKSFILKNVTGDELATIIRSTYRGQSTLAPEVARILIDSTIRPPSLGHDLTEREIEVLKMMIRGMNNRSISTQLCLSPSTIKNHVSNILSKLGTVSRTQAVALAIQQHLVDGNT